MTGGHAPAVATRLAAAGVTAARGRSRRGMFG